MTGRRLRNTGLLPILICSGCAIFGQKDFPDIGNNSDDGGMSADVAATDIGSDVATASDMGTEPDDGTTGDMEAVDMEAVDMDRPIDMQRPDCQAQVLAANLQVSWTTPNNIHVTWDRLNPETPVREYKMLVGRTSVDVQDEVNVRRYTAANNGELARTTGDYPVDWTVAWGLEPERDYFIKLLAYDNEWCHSESNIASGTTQPDVTNEHVIFSESPTAGFSVPAGVTFSNRNPFEGQFHYEWKVDCENATNCSDIVRRGGFRQQIQNFDETAFDRAFLEYAWHNEGGGFVQYPVARFALYDEATDTNEWYKSEKKAPTGPSSGYRLFQIPLRFMWREGDRADLTADRLNWQVSEFGVLANGDEGDFMNWDEVRIRW